MKMIDDYSSRGLKCRHCDGPMPSGLIAQTRYCSDECRRTVKLKRQKRYYKRVETPQLICVGCNEPFPAKSARGAKAKFCSDDCRKLHVREYQRNYRSAYAKPLGRIRCVECNEPFDQRSHSHILCSDRCVELNNARKRNVSGIQWVFDKEEGRRCPLCDKTFIPTHPNQKYCTPECKHENRDKIRRPETYKCKGCGEPFSPKRKDSRTFCGRECTQRYQCSEVMDDAKYAVPDGATEKRPCFNCDEPFPVKPGDRKRKYCSPRCRKKSAARIAGSTRRKNLKGARVETVDPYEICERDKWRCHLCGVRTPKRLRGTFDPRAPEVDHILPITAGGTHNYANLACACRDCNQKKGNKPLGQTFFDFAA